ncbi:MAG: hypothetical protein HZB43_08940 [candidate division Zixibacteria bacterium]|nr:hypothetical protein [candidate division Zixibacteria bacterium]
MAKKIEPPKKGQGQAHKTQGSAPKSGGSFAEMILAHPVRWAIIAYALFTVIFFIVPIFSPGKMIYGSDTMSAGVFFRSFYADFWRDNFRVPLWDPYIHGGLPFVDAMHGDIFYPAAILQIILPVTYAIGLKLILHVFLAGVFMFLFLRTIGRSDQTSFIGGALYMFAPCLVSLFLQGHDGKIYVMALTPLAFLLVHRGVVTRRLAPFLWFGLVYALMILTAHVQMAYYASWGLGLYFLFLLWEQHRFDFAKILTPILFFVVAVVLAMGASSIQWLAPYQYLAKYSQRIQHNENRGGFDWASSWSMHSEELLSEVNPSFPGEDLGDRPSTYWGQNFFKLNSEAVGVMALALAIVAVVAVRGPSMWFFAGLSLLTLLHALGATTPVFKLFFYFVPMVKKFRAPSMINFLFALSWIVMATRALEVLLTQTKANNPTSRRGAIDPLRLLLIIAMTYSVITLIALVTGSSLLTGWASLVGNPLTGNKAAAAQANAGPMRVGFLIGTVVLWALVGIFQARRKGSLGMGGATAGLLALAVLPNWQYDARFVMTVDPRSSYGERTILGAIKQQAGPAPYRVLNLPNTLEDNYLAMHGIEEVSPSQMHGNHLLTYDNFVGRHDAKPALLTDRATMDLLNVMLLVSPQPINQDGLQIAAQADGLYLIKNTSALPRAAVFYQYEVITDSNATLTRLRDPKFPYRSRLILDQALADIPPTGPDEAITQITPATVTDWQVDKFVVECNAERDGILWLSENYYPAWTAIDEAGQKLPVYRADYTFRAVPVKQGTHKITFEFRSATFSTSIWLSLVCVVILAGGAVMAGRRTEQDGPKRFALKRTPGLTPE